MKKRLLTGLLFVSFLQTGCTNNIQQNITKKDNESSSLKACRVFGIDSVYCHCSELFEDLMKHPDDKRYYALENAFSSSDIYSESLLYSLVAANKLGVDVAIIRVANCISEELSNPTIGKNTKEISLYYLKKWASRTKYKRAKLIVENFDTMSIKDRGIIVPAITYKSSEMQCLKAGCLKGSINDYKKLKEMMSNDRMYAFMLYYAYIMADRYNYLPAKEDVVTIITRFYREYNLGPIDKDTQYFCSFFKRICPRDFKTSTNGAQSPATRLEHEIDHAVDEADHPSEHRGRRDTANEQFGNEEEKRVIMGSELKTATANGETTRNNHYGTPYTVSSPISIF